MTPIRISQKFLQVVCWHCISPCWLSKLTEEQMVSLARTTNGKTWASKFQQLSYCNAMPILRTALDEPMRSQGHFLSFVERRKNWQAVSWHIDWLQSVQTGLTVSSYHKLHFFVYSLSGRITSSRSSAALICSLTWLLTCCYKPFRTLHKKIWVSSRSHTEVHPQRTNQQSDWDVQTCSNHSNPNSADMKRGETVVFTDMEDTLRSRKRLQKGHDRPCCSPGTKKLVKQLKTVWKWMNLNGMSWNNLKHKMNK